MCRRVPGYIFVFLAVVLLAAVSGRPLHAQTTTTNVHQGPVYNAAKDTYYELRIDNRDFIQGHYTNYDWGSASRRAARTVYKGRRGRLAIVRDSETLQFIRNNFTLREEAWVGLRFFCKFRKLIWVTGELQPLRAKSFWASRWHRTYITCRSEPRMEFMGVYLTKSSHGVRWQAAGQSKGFFSYIVEYPPEGKSGESKAEAAPGK